ncbi:O-methyltransferase [Talaromyces stipitatus ATCC 10500]|uniref:O-methyltransferase n=1 Tax=Talaromyces stipitatus (strain ATCC 10500 / CBS 375.48 / QM 6759 / NRRL 1006) TaxID=441959 RepID=B8MF11_TALSN|nr:O-methyltransferase [Talaromyces stipitatus ATCC 10500]EED15780.1 O-methyltransferase [Talaromyces stipitatus ATCC 10500]
MGSTIKSSARVSARLKELVQKSEHLNMDVADERRQLSHLVQSLGYELETPMESIYRLIVIQPLLYMCVRVAINLNLFEIMAEDESVPKNVSQLALRVGADETLLGRLLKNMAASDLISETASDTYELTTLSASLLKISHRDAFPFCHDVLLPSFSATPRFLAETRYANPTNITDTPFQFGHHTKRTFFEYLGTYPEQAQQFNNFMGLYATDRPRWLDEGHFPVREILGEGASEEKDAVLMVDVGGGKGHDLILFQQRYGDLPGRLILQDLPSVVKQAGQLSAGLESMGHDFFTENPIKGARTYYFHSVLHGWPDEKCLDILRQIAAAMKRGYSKLLINEIVIPDTNAHRLATSMDLLMMTVVAAEERTEQKWKYLLPLVGLKIVKIWKFEIGTESLIEAELAGD